VDKLQNNNLIAAVSDPEASDIHKGIKAAYDEWARAAQDFRANYGEGMVVGVLWGDIGRSQMTIMEERTIAARWPPSFLTCWRACRPPSASPALPAASASVRFVGSTR
jgi:hypothetical protein